MRLRTVIPGGESEKDKKKVVHLIEFKLTGCSLGDKVERPEKQLGAESICSLQIFLNKTQN